MSVGHSSNVTRDLALERCRSMPSGDKDPPNVRWGGGWGGSGPEGQEDFQKWVQLEKNEKHSTGRTECVRREATQEVTAVGVAERKAGGIRDQACCRYSKIKLVVAETAEAVGGERTITRGSLGGSDGRKTKTSRKDRRHGGDKASSTKGSKGEFSRVKSRARCSTSANARGGVKVEVMAESAASVNSEARCRVWRQSNQSDKGKVWLRALNTQALRRDPPKPKDTWSPQSRARHCPPRPSKVTDEASLETTIRCGAWSRQGEEEAPWEDRPKEKPGHWEDKVRTSAGGESEARRSVTQYER